MKHIYWLVICLGVLLCARPAQAGLGIAARAGTPGLGFEVTKSLIPMVNLRGGADFYNYSFDVTEGEIKYDFDLQLRSFALLVDLHPAPLMGFRVSGGLIFNNNNVDMISDPQDSYEIGDRTYTGSQVGQLIGEMGFRKIAPYLGLGWGNAANSRVGFAFDLGVAIQGSPDVALGVSKSIAQDPAFQADLRREEQEIQDGVNLLRYYPVVSIGLSFRLSAL